MNVPPPRRGHFLVGPAPVSYPAGMRTLAIFLLSTGLAFAQTGVYRWVAPDGSVTFSDQSRPGAEKIQVKVPGAPAPGGAAGTASAGAEGVPGEASAGAPYTEFVIISPTDDEAVRSNNGSVGVSMSLAPSLHAQHAVVVSVNGQKVGKGSSTSLTLQNLPRGTHTVQAAVVDETGKEVIRSKSVTFHILRI